MVNKTKLYIFVVAYYTTNGKNYHSKHPRNTNLSSLSRLGNKPFVFGGLCFMPYNLKVNKDGVPILVANVWGLKFNMLTIQEFSHSKRGIPKGVSHFAVCKCDCGNTKVMNVQLVKSKKVFSCGCHSSKLKSERFTKHGMSRSNIYSIHRAILARCYDKKNKKYRIYGGMGKVVCYGWRNKENGFINFKNDTLPKTDKTIDRIKSELNYSCGHCKECLKNGWDANWRWASYETQANNTIRNVYVEYLGEKLTVTQLARKIGIPGRGLFYRLNSGWELEDALTIPFDLVSHKSNKNILVMVNGKEMSLAEAERALGYKRGILSNRLKRGWNKEDAISIKPSLQNKKNHNVRN